MTTDAGEALPTFAYMTATEELFATLGIPVVRGRAFTSDDRYGAPGVVVLSESAARQLFPGVNPIGARVGFDLRRSGDTLSRWRQVVGVVGDIRESVSSDPRPTVYVSNWQEGMAAGELVVRTTGRAAALIPAIRGVLHDLDPLLPLIRPRPMSEVLREFVAQQWLAMTLMGAFAVLALILAALGVYAVMAYAVAARTREFGIRSALGARRGGLVMLVLRQGIHTAATGATLGLVIAGLSSKVIAGLLSDISPHDRITFVAAPAVLFAVTLLACVLPARAATRVQPVDALRAE